MIEFKTISTSDIEEYQFMESLLQTAFPKEEYRDLNDLKKYTDDIEIFYNNIILEDNKPIGFITYWNFNDFY